MAKGKAILQSISPKFGPIGFRATILGHNLSGDITINFKNGPQIGLSIPLVNNSETSLAFTVPKGTEGRYDLEIINSFGIAEKEIEFHIAQNSMDGIKVCPPKYTEANIASQGQEYLPKGPAWTRSIYTYMNKFFAAIAVSLKEFQENTCRLIMETTPQLTSDLIPEWEEELGLPEPCVQNPSTDLVARRAEIVRKTNAFGGADKQYFIDLAASMGLLITIDESYLNASPFLAGHSVAGDALYQGPWLFTWSINVFEFEIETFQAGQNVEGDPLRFWGNNELECFFNLLKPAHTILNFRYQSDTPDDLLMAGDTTEIMAGDTGDEMIGVL